MSLIAIPGGAAMAFSQNLVARVLAGVHTMVARERWHGLRPPPIVSTPKLVGRSAVNAVRQVNFAVECQAVPLEIAEDLGQRPQHKPGRRVSYRTVREVVQSGRDLLQQVEVPTSEACAAGTWTIWTLPLVQNT